VDAPAVALRELDAFDDGARLDDYYLLHATRAELLARLGRPEDAARALTRALACRCSAPERRLLERRLAGI
jgi:RNA polymerase sigma-70 factor (ECF subfamily)